MASIVVAGQDAACIDLVSAIIEGLGHKQIEAFWEEELIKSPADIFRLESRAQSGEIELDTREGWGPLSVGNLYYAVNQRRHMDLERFVYALGIPHIGRANARLLAKTYLSLEALIAAGTAAQARQSSDYEDMLNIDGIGVKVANAFIDFLDEPHNRQVVEELAAQAPEPLSPSSSTGQGRQQPF
ncbi:MAG: hypothetical protein IIB38_12945, partial [Candidatus Hydrogenedentes bacterium]|nr:hypothetical protein [Candidatus Hydrogenedentota bacterium]